MHPAALQPISRPFLRSDRNDSSKVAKIQLGADALGRTTSVDWPKKTGVGVDRTTITYNGLSVKRTNAKLQSRTEVSNGLGLPKSATDANSKTTSYLYDPFGHLLRTTDPAANQINIKVDRLGRKTQLKDPDLGTWNYLVDPLGQTYQQTDAKSQRLPAHAHLRRLGP